jgi:hypothetical protein
VSRCVNDVNFGVLVRNGGVLAKDGDASLSFQVVRVHDALLHSLVVTKNLEEGQVKGIRNGIEEMRRDGVIKGSA